MSDDTRTGTPSTGAGRPDGREILSGMWVRWTKSHLALRLTVGVIAVCLPVLVVSVVAAAEGSLLGSISESYHHRYANSLFIGSMCAFAAFLWAYNYGGLENRWGNRGAIAAASVAVFSTAPVATVVAADHVGPGSLDTAYSVVAPSWPEQASGIVHFIAAGTLFYVLAKFCRIWRDDETRIGPKSHYAACNVIIVAMLVVAVAVEIVGRLIAASELTGATSLQLRLVSTVFFLAEVAMVGAFGYSWLIRGGAAPRAAGVAAAASGGGTLLVVVVFSVHQWLAIDDPAPAPLRVAAAVVGVVSAAAVIVALRGQQPSQSFLLEALEGGPVVQPGTEESPI